MTAIQSQILSPLFVLLIFLSTDILGQPPTSDFIFTDNPCIGETVDFNSNSINEDTYLWDFCAGDFNTNPNVTNVFTVSGTSTPIGISVIEEGGFWYGFVVNRSNNKLFRLDFGNSLANVPIPNDLGNLSVLNTPDEIYFYKENGLWYALVSSDASPYNLVRLSFISGIENIPIADNLGNFGGELNRPRGVSVQNDDGQVVAVLSNLGTGRLTLLDFGTSITTDLLNINSLNSSVISGTSSIFDISIINSNGLWYGFIASLGNNTIHRLDFGNNLYSIPTNTESFSPSGSVGPSAIDVIQEGDSHYIFLGRGSNSYNTNLYRLDDISGAFTPVEIGINNSEVLSSIDIVDFNGGKYVVGINTSGDLYTYDYNSNCLADKYFSTEENPSNVFYEVSGGFLVSLRASNINGSDFSSQTITVTSDIAPDIDFTIDESRCVTNMNQFTSINTSGDITSYSWDFDGDGIEDSTDPNPIFQFPSTGTYQITLSVESSSGCSNQITNGITIYDPPLTPINFDVSSMSTFCNNSDLHFSYTIEPILNGIASYLWDFNGESSSSDQNPVFAFTTSGIKTVGLQVIIPGCTTNIYTEDIEIFQGPLSAFTYTNNCFGEEIQFTDESIGGTGNIWDFGDGSAIESDASNPIHKYATSGIYTVELVVVNASGCETVTTQEIEVTDSPLASFTTGETVENLPVQFVGIEHTLSDNYVISWSWDFAGQGSSFDQFPMFTFPQPGIYQIELIVNTSQGCTDVITKNIEVIEAICPTSSFMIPTSVCRNEIIDFENTSANAENYEWNFCSSNLGNTPQQYDRVSGVGGSLPLSATYVESSGEWYGFITDRTGNSLIRLDFGLDLGSDPTVNDLGNPSSLFNLPDKIQIIEESGNWYGLVLSDGGDFNLTLLNFGNSLSNDPVATNLGNPENSLNRSRGLELHKDSNGSLIAVITNLGNNTLVQLNFGSSITNVLTAPNVLVTDLSAYSGLLDITLGRDCNNWYGLLCAQGSDQIVRLDFGNSLFTTPIASPLPDSYLSVRRIALAHDGVNFRTFLIDGNNELFRLDFDNGLSLDPVTTSLTSDFSNLSGLEIVNDTVGFMLDIVSRDLIRIDFGNNCPVTIRISTEPEPSNISFSDPGDYLISLRATNEMGNFSYSSQTITVTTDTAPDITFTLDNSRCITNTNQFTSINTSGDITSYSWDFDGDGAEDSTDPNPVFQFAAAGDYEVSLAVGNSGCSNSIRQTITILPEPETPVFEVIGTVFCIGDEVSFNNLSIETGLEDVISYKWDFNGEGTSDLKVPTFAFSTPGEKQISLQAVIPGCETEVINQTLTVNEAPQLDFDFTRVCAGETTAFFDVSLSTNLENYNWDFNDGFTSTSQNPEHVFPANGLYTVSLTAVDANGCVNTIMKEVEVGQIPKPKFSIEADQTCNQVEIQFNDITDNSVANISSRLWEISGLEPSSEINPRFTFVDPGDYNVTFTVTNDFNCTAVLDSVITVISSPVAQIEVVKGCVGEETRFFDRTSGNIQSWFWLINGETFIEPNPVRIFDSPGSYQVSLEVTSDNFCVSSGSMVIDIEALPAVDFTIESNCLNEQIRFTDNTTIFSDPVITRTWDFGDGTTANGLNSFHQYTTPGTYEVTLSMETQNGCAVSSTKTVIINEAPVAGFVADVDFGIPPFNVIVSGNATGFNTSEWFLNDQFLAVDNPVNPTIPIAENGLFRLKQRVTNEFGCKDSLEIVIISGLPAYDLVLTGFEVIEVGETSTFAVSILNNSNLPVKDFDVDLTLENNALIREKYTDIIRPGQTGIYRLNTVVPKQNLGFVCINLGTANEQFPDINPDNNQNCRNIVTDPQVSEAFPNPALDDVEVKVIFDQPEAFSLKLVDMFGNVIISNDYEASDEPLNRVRINLTNLSKGIYLAVFTFNDIQEVRRIIKY